jgi:hypothetical protein
VYLNDLAKRQAFDVAADDFLGSADFGGSLHPNFTGVFGAIGELLVGTGVVGVVLVLLEAARPVGVLFGAASGHTYGYGSRSEDLWGNRGSTRKQNGRKRLLAAKLQCPGQDLNLHELPRYHLKVVRLPIPPPGLMSEGIIPARSVLSRVIKNSGRAIMGAA